MKKCFNPLRILFLLITATILIAPFHQAFANGYIDIPYVSGSTLKEQMLDIYTPSDEDTEKPRPVFVFVHGGAWTMGDKSVITHERAKAYTNQGIIVVSVNYRLSPEYKHPDHVKDLAAASKWLADHISEYGGDPKRMILSGHSAGAHLVALLATDPLYLGLHNLPLTLYNCVVPVDTASFDLTKPQTFRIIQRMRNKAFGTDETKLANVSPTLLIEKGRNYSPFFLYVTAKRPDAVWDTKRFANALNNKGAFARNIVIDKNYTHRDMGKAIFDPRSQIYKDIMSVFGKKM